MTLIHEPDLSDVFRYTNEVRNAYQQQIADIQINIGRAGLGGLLT